MGHMENSTLEICLTELAELKVQHKQLLTDHTQLKHDLRLSIQHLNSILENTPAGVAILEGEDFVYRLVNRRLADINGLSVEAHLGQPLKKILPTIALNILPRLQAVVDTGLPTKSREFSANMPNDPNNIRWFIDSFFPISTPENTSKAVGVIVIDITEQKRAELAFQKANKELKREIQERSIAENSLLKIQQQLTHVLRVHTMTEMASGIAHELNQPLAAIVNYSQGCANLIYRGKKKLDVFIEIFEKVKSEALRCHAIINRLKRLVINKAPDIENFQLKEIVEDVISLMRSDLREANIIINVEIDDNIPHLNTDKIQLSQTLINLFTNAMDSIIDANSNRLTIDLIVKLINNNIIMKIRDYGLGIAPELTDKLFDPYVSTKKVGLGMGLTISRSIIEALGGTLLLVPQKGLGACFEITLPMKNKKCVN